MGYKVQNQHVVLHVSHAKIQENVNISGFFKTSNIYAHIIKKVIHSVGYFGFL